MLYHLWQYVKFSSNVCFLCNLAGGFAATIFYLIIKYKNWSWCGLLRSGSYCNAEQRELCRPLGAACGRHNECSAGFQYQLRHHKAYKWSISIIPRSQFTKSKGNLCFRHLVPLFVPIGVCVTTHDDGTASDVTIGLWRHNQQATNYERKGKPRFSFPMYLSHVIFKWWYAVEWMMIRKYVQVMPWMQKKLHIGKSKGHKNFEAMRFCFGHVSLVVTFARRLPEVCLKCNECNFGGIWCCATLFPSVHFVDAEIHDGFSDGVLETFTQAFQKFPN